ncbi:flavin reductase family protein [Crenobacter intestini]|uniref:Flavin reductase family protein n=1 Tax=Crenobacter intestini TaxID=2563443 RepID=A0A4T0UMB7_9NEIS|nr:flavin reductase family protein [Crenobacter intestini]TIC79788.1 flavin reductase family protein [Crenobacter intestini]
MTDFKSQEFRHALGAFTTGVTIVTTCDADGEPVGVTANSFNSVSLDPPLVLWSIAKTARSLGAFAHSGHWTVHVLSAEQEGLSDRFARRGEDKFAGLETETGSNGCPLLTGCAARFQCRTSFEYDGGDHLILVGEVVAFDREDKAPLVFHGGRYALATRKGGESPAADEPHSFSEDFLGYLVGRAHYQFLGALRGELEEQGLTDPEFFALSTLLQRGTQSQAALDELMRHSGFLPQFSPLTRLAARHLLEAQTVEGAPGYALTASGRAVVVRLVAVAKAREADLVEKLGQWDARVLKNLLKQMIALTDNGTVKVWHPQDGRAA